jgi:hypothetical protein
MRWLVTTPAETVARVRRDLAEVGATIAEEQATPLEPGELVLHVEGPNDLPQRLQARGTPATAYPDSEQDWSGGCT